MTRPSLSDEDIFQVARRIEERTARAAYLEQICGGDVALRKQVDTLLAAHDDSPSFLESPHSAIAAFQLTTDQPITEKPGTEVESYKLLQQIGEGGFGVVYMAEQTKPIRRKVALKIIKPGMDTREVIARFEAERQALALMDHPNIAKVLDAGATDSGRPYFVMELVKGMPLTEYCDRNRLPGRERLKLFIDVCHAIQHAHQKGIIHRDLKPTNIMVTLHDGRPVPKVIDFGVSKALSQQLTEKTLFTAYGQMIGTPTYMSPEQAEMSGLDVDTRSDIYSLGVLLYELLTGSTPFDSKRLREAGYAEMQRIIREEEPPKPSTRLTSLGEDSAVVSSNRGTDPKKLGQLVRGELDWIVMKALDKDRNRRYETANGFAADIERFLTDEPVAACPPSAMYRFRKFARRNKGPTAVVMVAALALIVVAVGATFAAGSFRNLAERLEHSLIAETDAKNVARDAQQESEQARDREQWQREEAERQTEIARQQTRRAEDALANAQEQRERAEANFALARSAVDQFLSEVTDTDLLTVPGMQPLRQKLLSSALGFYEDFTQDEENATELLVELASAHYRIGVIRAELGLEQAAADSNARSIELFEQLISGSDDSLEVRLGLAKACFRAERYDETVTLCRQILESDPHDAETRSLLGDTYNSLAIDDKNDGDIAAALAYHQQALPLREGLVQEFPDNAAYLAELGSTINNIGVLLWNQNRYRDALAMFERAVTYSADAYEKSPQQMNYGHLLSLQMGNVALYQRHFGKPEAALELFQRVVTVRRKLAFENPAMPSLKGELYKAWIALANYQQELDRSEEARRSFNAAREVLENLPHETPNELFGLATVYAALAAPIGGSADVPDENPTDEDHQHYADLAVESLRQAVDAGYRDLEAIRSSPQLEVLRKQGDLPELALLEVRLETELLEANDLLQADETATDHSRTADHSRAAKLLRDLVAGNASEGRNQQTRAATLHAMGVIQTGLKQYGPAEQSLNEALQLCQEQLAERRDNLQLRLDVLATRSALGSLFWNSRREPEAHGIWQECLAEFQRLAEDVPHDQEELLKRVLHEERQIGDAYANIGIFEPPSEYVGRYLDYKWTNLGRQFVSLALTGDFDAHRRYTRLLAEQGRTSPEEVLWVASASPDAGLTPDELRDLLSRVEGKTHFWPRFLAATGEYRAGRYQQALDHLDASRIGDAAKYRDYWRAMILENLGRHSEAVTWLDKAEALYGEFISGKAKRGVARGIGWFIAYAEVIRREAWNEVMGHAPPDDPWQHVLQAIAYQSIGEDEQVGREVAAALVAASDPTSVVSVLDSLGDLKAGFAVAEESFREQLEVRQQILAESDDPARAELDVLQARYAIGKLYWVSGRLPEAHQLWQQLLPDVPAVSEAVRDNEPLWQEALEIERNICNAYGRIGLWELAAQHSRYDIQLSRRRTKSPDAWMSSALAALGRMDEYRAYHEFYYTQYQDGGAENWGPWQVVRMTWHAGLLPDPTIPPEQLVSVTRAAFDATPGWDLFPLTLALASVRNGEFDEVLALVDDTKWAEADKPERDHWRTLFAPYLRAIAHQELQQFDEAQRMLDAAEQKYREICQATIEISELTFAAPISDEWYWLAFAQQLRREAREKLDGAPPPDDPWQHLIQARGYRLIGEHELAEQELVAAAVAAGNDSDSLIMIARWYAQRGEQEKADADFARAASLTPNELNRFLEAGWWIVGPYRPNLDEVGPPELDPDPSRPVHVIDPQTGLSTEPVAWRNMPAGEAGRIDFSTLVANGQDASFYALAHVYSPDERTVSLRTDQDLPLRVWVNGARCLTIAFPVIELARSYYLTPLTLRPGRNTLLLKLGVSAETAPVWIRLNDHPVERAFDLARAGLTDEAGDVLAAGYSETHVKDWGWLISKYRCGFRHHPETLHAMTHDLLARDHHDGVIFGARLADCPADREVLNAFATDSRVTERSSNLLWRSAVAKVYARLGQWENVLSVTDEGAAEQIPLRAMAYHHLGQHERARELLDESIDRLQRHVDRNADAALVEFGVSRVFVTTREACALILGDTEQVDAIYDDFQQIRREMWQARDAATEAFDDLVAIAPDDPQAWLARGRRLAELGRLDKAAADFSTAIALAPDDPYLLINFAPDEKTAELAETKSTGTLDSRTLVGLISSIIAEYPDSPALYAQRARVLARLERFDEAASDIAVVVERSGETELTDDLRTLLVDLSDALANNGKWDLAVQTFKWLVADSPSRLDFHRNLALCALKAEGADAYREQCRAIVAKAKDLGDPRMTRVAVSACLAIPDALEDQTVLVDLARQVAAAAPDPPTWTRNVLAGALLRSGQIDEALRLLHEIAADETRQAPGLVYFRLAIAYHALGDEEQAAAWLQAGDQWRRQARETGGLEGWRRSLSAQICQQEAHQLLGVPLDGSSEPAIEPAPD